MESRHVHFPGWQGAQRGGHEDRFAGEGGAILHYGMFDNLDTAFAVFPLKPTDLVALASGRWVMLAEG